MKKGLSKATKAPVEDDGPICLRLYDAMRELGVGKTKIYELIADGKIEAIKIGRSTMVIRKSLLDLINSADRV
ncbi:helix-turn-helix domain-containing protein [Sphingomonas sp.]|uniref:helix-turn-helix domain-containing protein n=1 Tax=Sphingomonas sp. TaxID=28214 RepID=UPI0025F1002A|nr:helix-turn-helix domain-containing protein [Sphingomonas sp.]MBV9529091.1 helix-turn-helix domain-containing protein [Sphingomonas sp.]